MVEIIEIQKDTSLFDGIPQSIYPPDSLRLKQRDSVNMEYIYKTLVAISKNIPSARLVIYNNPHLKYENERAACIGNFESIDNADVSCELLNKAFQIIKEELKINYVIGPMNGSTWDNYRFSVHHHSPNFFLEPYHHLYYNNLFIAAGFMPLSKYVSAIDTELHHSADKNLLLEEKLKQGGVVFRPMDFDNYENEIERVFDLCTRAFKNNFLYTPISIDVFKEKYLAVKPFISPDFIQLAEDNNSGNLIGFIFALNDLNNPERKSLIIKTLARENKKQWAGLGGIMVNNIVKKAADNKYKSVIHAFMIENAASANISKSFTGSIYKNYILYGKKL